jgi:hypothetical protein
VRQRSADPFRPPAPRAPVGTAAAALYTAATRGGALLSDPARATVLATVAGWDGTHPPLGGGWLERPLAALPAPDRPGARLALLAALAPYRVADADVAAWRATRPADADLVRLLAFGAMAAVERIEASIGAPAAAPDGGTRRGSGPAPAERAPAPATR